jgi:putative tricarboxylic transport membrane protein
MGYFFSFVKQTKKAQALVVGALFLTVLLAPTGADAGWKPTRSVELLIPAGVGGGNDRAGRMIHKIIKDHKFLPVSMSVVNKRGAGGAIAYAYLNQFKGDGHHISIFPTALLTRPISGRSDVTFRQLTPLAHLLKEYSVLSVKGDSPIKDGKDLIRRLKEDIHSLSFAIGSSRLNTQGMALASVMDYVGLDYKDLKLVTAKSGGKSYASVLGGHVDVWGASVSNATKRLRKGEMRGIAISSPTQLGGDMAGIQTWKEQGIDIEFFGLRGMLGPGGLSKDQIAYWDGVISKVVATKDFKAYAQKAGAVIDYTNSKETYDLLSSLEIEYTKRMKKFGLIKKKKK